LGSGVEGQALQTRGETEIIRNQLNLCEHTNKIKALLYSTETNNNITSTRCSGVAMRGAWWTVGEPRSKSTYGEITHYGSITNSILLVSHMFSKINLQKIY
jgi:hypothetical protein